MTGGKYQRYPEYKRAASEWMSEIPKHWEVKSLKSVLDERKESNRPIKTTQILSLTMEKGVVPYSERGGGGNKHKDDLTAYKLAYPNDIVLNSMNVVVGSVGLSRYFGAVSPVYYMLRPRREEDRVKYFSHIFQSKTFQQSLLGLGNGIMMKQAEASGKLNTIRMRIPMGKLNTQLLPRPSTEEQTQIAKFLDYETAKIDALIEKQQQLIALLKEKRQAVISHAVTKGLNPDVPMRDSGVEWLGEVPAHWEVGALSYALNAVGDVDHYMPPSVDKGVPYVMTGDLEEFASEIDFTRCKQVAHHDYLRLCKKIKTTKGDLIMARYATIGTVSYVDLDSEFLVSYSCVTIKPNAEKALGRYLFFCLKSDSFVQGIQERINTNTQGNVGIADLRKVKVALPAIEEQLKIAEYLQVRVAEMGKVLESSEAAVGLLQERRTALISAAVTGKIDVRGWKAPESEAEAEVA